MRRDGEIDREKERDAFFNFILENGRIIWKEEHLRILKTVLFIS